MTLYILHIFADCIVDMNQMTNIPVPKYTGHYYDYYTIQIYALCPVTDRKLSAKTYNLGWYLCNRLLSLYTSSSTTFMQSFGLRIDGVLKLSQFKKWPESIMWVRKKRNIRSLRQFYRFRQSRWRPRAFPRPWVTCPIMASTITEFKFIGPLPVI